MTLANIIGSIKRKYISPSINSLDTFLDAADSQSMTQVDIYPISYPIPVVRIGAAPHDLPPSFFLRYAAGNIQYQEKIDLSGASSEYGGLALLVVAEKQAETIIAKKPNFAVNVHAQKGPLSREIREAVMQYAASKGIVGQKTSNYS